MHINVEKSILFENGFPKEIRDKLRAEFPYTIKPMDEGFKYLGFVLKPNVYSFKDWMWLYKKIGCCTYKFLSRGERLVLLKAVLQSIPVYWATIAYIPKGILQKLRKKFFSFIWFANRHSEGIPLAKWQVLASPKDLGGWGIKNPFLFVNLCLPKNYDD